MQPQHSSDNPKHLSPEVLNQCWFLISLIPLLAFLISEVVFGIARSSIFFGPQMNALDQKFIEIRLFYGTSVLGIPFIYFLQKKLIRPSLIAGGKLQTLSFLILIYIWANTYESPDSLKIINIFLFLLFFLISLPSYLGKVDNSFLDKPINKYFPTLFLWFTTIASISLCSSDKANKLLLPLCLGFTAVILSFLLKKLSSRSLRIPNSIYGVFIFLLFLSVFPGICSVNWFHMSSILGPVIQDMFGNALLVNVESQYGLANIWFLTYIFKALGGISFYKAYYVNLAFYLITFGMTLWIMANLFKSYAISFVAFLIIITFSIWSHVPGIYSYYSLGPFRFGFFFAILMIAVLRQKQSVQSSYFNWAEAFIIGLASIWSMEAAIFVIFPYLALFVYEKRLWVASRKAFLSVLVFWCFAELRIWWMSGEFAAIRLFWEYITLNVADGFSSVIMLAKGTWVPVWILLTTSTSVCFLGFLKNKKDAVFLILSTTLFVTTSYYVNRAIDAIFLSLSPVIALLCFYYAVKVFPARYFHYVLAFILTIWVFYLQSGIQDYVGPAASTVLINAKNIGDNTLKFFMPNEFPDWLDRKNAPCSSISKELELIKKYDNKETPLFLIPSWNMDVLDFMSSMCLNRPNAFNLNPAVITDISVRAMDKKIQDMQSRSFLIGQVLFIDDHFFHPEKIPKAFPAREKSVSLEMFKVLSKRYEYKILETSGSLTAVQITKHL